MEVGKTFQCTKIHEIIVIYTGAELESLSKFLFVVCAVETAFSEKLQALKCGVDMSGSIVIAPDRTYYLINIRRAEHPAHRNGTRVRPCKRTLIRCYSGRIYRYRTSYEAP